MIKTRDAVWLMALAIAAGACKKGKAGGPDPAGGGRGGAPMGMPVEVVVARTDTVRDEISATGQIEAVQSIELRPEVDGRIVEILIRRCGRPPRAAARWIARLRSAARGGRPHRRDPDSRGTGGRAG